MRLQKRAIGDEARRAPHWWRRPARTARLVEDLQTRVDQAIEDLEALENTATELRERIERHQANRVELERRIAALERTIETAVRRLGESHERHRRHLTRLEQTVEKQLHGVHALEQLLDEGERG